ncbi:ATP-grasp domain-containing protein [Streptomyces sp. URMC 127]|uniref:ATP-grasp domain-containing protein n=1 Tax=Streptomyces sp. URMC 127 TaxID=3423402 RepID=UPI003F199E89
MVDGGTRDGRLRTHTDTPHPKEVARPFTLTTQNRPPRQSGGSPGRWPSRGSGGSGVRGGRTGGHYFGGPLFAAGIADELEIALLEPADDWLTALPHEYTLRNVVSSTLSEARRLTRPAFVKPPSDKSFPAAVHTDGSTLPRTSDLPPDTPVQISDVVTWAREFRLFVLDGECRTGSQYATFGRLDAAPLRGHPDEEVVREFASNLLAAHSHTLPSAAVLDVGLLSASGGDAHGWAVVEANMPWFANCYASDPDRVLDVVLRAAGPRSRLAARDRGFCRHLKDS